MEDKFELIHRGIQDMRASPNDLPALRFVVLLARIHTPRIWTIGFKRYQWLCRVASRKESSFSASLYPLYYINWLHDTRLPHRKWSDIFHSMSSALTFVTSVRFICSVNLVVTWLYADEAVNLMPIMDSIVLTDINSFTLSVWSRLAFLLVCISSYTA